MREVGDRWYGRGVVDNKGQHSINLGGLKAVLETRGKLGFNAKYLQEIAAQIDRENAVFLFNGAGDAALIREGGDESAVYVVMPMRV